VTTLHAIFFESNSVIVVGKEKIGFLDGTASGITVIGF
jgi:hypothetical protein